MRMRCGGEGVEGDFDGDNVVDILFTEFIHENHVEQYKVFVFYVDVYLWIWKRGVFVSRVLSHVWHICGDVMRKCLWVGRVDNNFVYLCVLVCMFCKVFGYHDI